MLTRQYLLKDTEILHVMNSKQQGSISIGALATGVLTGVPVGGSINIRPKDFSKAKLYISGELVWAARFHKIKLS